MAMLNNQMIISVVITIIPVFISDVIFLHYFCELR